MIAFERVSKAYRTTVGRKVVLDDARPGGTSAFSAPTAPENRHCFA
jgi:hypothetical protein